MKVKVIRLVMVISQTLHAWIVSEIIKHLLFSWVRSVWPWMKVKVDIINTWYILMSEAVTVPSLTMMTNSFRGIACEGHTHIARDTHTHTHRHGFGSMLKFAFKNKEKLFFLCFECRVNWVFVLCVIHFQTQCYTDFCLNVKSMTIANFLIFALFCRSWQKIQTNLCHPCMVQPISCVSLVSNP